MLASLLSLTVAYAETPSAEAAPTVVEAPAPDEVSLRVSLLPGVGLGADPDAAVDGIAVGLVSRASSLRGIDAELGLSWVDGEVRGVQGALGAAVAGELRGAQLGVGLNVAGDVAGVQGTAGVNVARDVRGAQGSAGINVARDVRGVQAAPVNVARGVGGLQVGLLNVGRDVDGVQLGLINVAKTSDVSIAPINLIGDGLHRVDVWTSDSAVVNLGLKLGSKQVYTLGGVGFVNPGQSYWTFGGGFGVHLALRPFWVEIDNAVYGVADGVVLMPGVHDKLRVQLGLDIARHFAPFVGASVNAWVGDGSVWPRAIGVPSQARDEHRIVAWPGVHAGLSF